jgi:iron complex transport system substrate-binding protein
MMRALLLSVLLAAPAVAAPTRGAASLAAPARGAASLAAPTRGAPALAAPMRVASLNLCSDELALLLAAPGQLVSVSRLGADGNETVLAGRARGLAVNRGRVTDVVGLSPDLVITSGGDPNAAATAKRLGLRVLELPQPETLADVRANVRRVAAALGRSAAGEAEIARMDAALAGAPAATPALLISGGGLTVAADGLAAEWLRHAGLAQQRVPRGQLSLERLLTDPPKLLVVTQYRSNQTSLNQAWLQHPVLAALPTSVRRVESDGRGWTCLGPTLAPEIARLRALAGP